MSKKQWLSLLILFLFYLLFGAAIFYKIERPLELQKIEIAKRERIQINALLKEHYVPGGGHDQHEIFTKLTRYCGKSVHNYSEGETDNIKWDFYNSFYFAYTVVSTIGYGNLAPTDTGSRILMIFYALFGIPINGILLAQLGEFFGQTFVTAVKRYKTYKQNQNDYSKKSLSSLEKRRFSLAMQITAYLIPGFIMFIFFPAFLFSHYEGWSYEEAVYYAFVTLTTIGFGDYVAGQDNTKGDGIWFGLYKTFLIVWISFGLGYIVMIMTFIGRGMTSKKIARLEHKLAAKLKNTQSKIWNEFNEDVNYLRRIFNELQFSKVKTVYVDEYDYDTPPPHFPRSNSFPDLRELVYGGLEPPTPPHPRRRANSEVVPMEAQVARVVSETDLQRIDKRATFATHAMVQPAELLARLVNILGYIPPPPDDDELEPTDKAGGVCAGGGIQGFSEKDILASETTPWTPQATEPFKWKLGADSPKPYRSRAASEVRLEHPSQFLQPSACEWTWSGPAASNKIQEMMRARKNTVIPETSSKDGKSRFLGLPNKKALLPRWIRLLKKPQDSTTGPTDDVEAAPDANENREFEATPQTPGGRSRLQSGLDRRNSFSGTHLTYPAGSNLLEETSLADFIRALTSLHSRVGAMPDDFQKNLTVGPQMPPQRKLGTASLTPPKVSSLLTLFSPPAGHTQSQQNTVTSMTPAPIRDRRFSLRAAESSGPSTPLYQRRSTAGAAKLARRFSLRPVVNLPTRQYSSPYAQNMDGRPSPPAYSADPFVLDSQKKPLVQMESALGLSTPAHQQHTSSTGRRFSLRPAQIGVPPAPSSASIAAAAAAAAATAAQHPVRAVPRWKAGMLQRQIVGKNAQRRVRAFSLSDVNEETDRRIGISPLALHDNARTITSVQGQRMAAQKTVTIISPRNSEHSSNLLDPNNRNPFGFRRYNSDIESVSSRSSSHSSKSLDKDGSSRKSSDDNVHSKASWKTPEPDDEYKWDFDDGPSKDNQDVLTAIVLQSDTVTRRLSGEEEEKDEKVVLRKSSRKEEHQASASRKPSIASIEPWDSHSRKISTTSTDKFNEGESKSDPSDKPR